MTELNLYSSRDIDSSYNMTSTEGHVQDKVKVTLRHNDKEVFGLQVQN